jgi:uncharacterized protein
MTSDLESLKGTYAILLTMFRRNGGPVATPVSVAFDGDRAFFCSYDRAWKTKRLHGNKSVDVAPATARGRRSGPTLHTQPVLLTGGQADIAAKELARRHRVLQAVVVPLPHRGMRYRTLHYELHPQDPNLR